MTTPAPQKRPAFEPAERLLTPTGYNPDMPRPASTIAGAVLVMLRVLAGVVVLVALASGWGTIALEFESDVVGFELGAEASQSALWVIITVGAVFLAIDALFAVLIYRGQNWPRVLVMLFSVFSICTSFAAWWASGEEITIFGTFLSLSLDILVLLALSSRSAAAYARRRERR